MLKKINKYLLENHPLVWNTKIVWMLPILLALHFAFYLAGFFSFSELKELQKSYSFFERYFNSGVVWIGVLLSILVFIVWMYKYFKQNAFKSFYPKKNISLFAEFVFVFVICFLNISFYISYTEGLRQKVSQSISMEQLEYEVDIVNKGAAFTLQSGYDHEYRYISVPVFDSLVSEEEVLKLWVENAVLECRKYEKKYGKYVERQSINEDEPDIIMDREEYLYNKWKNVDSKDYLLYKDSLPKPYYTNSEYTYLLLEKHFPERQYKPNTEDEEEDIDYPNNYGNKHVNSIYNSYNQPILLHSNLYDECFNRYFNRYVEDVVEENVEYVDLYRNDFEKESKEFQYYTLYVVDLLQNNKKEEIEKLLNDYLTIADKYEISYRFKDKKWIDYVYYPPYYFADYYLGETSAYDKYSKAYKPVDHIEKHDIHRCMHNLINSKSNVISSDTVFMLLCIALFSAILIYAFRITSLRIWLMSVVGAIVVIFIFLAILFISDKLFGLAGYSEDIWMINLCFVFILIFWAFTIFCIRKNKMKKISGMILNWGIVTFPVISLLIAFRYNIYLKELYNNVELGYYYNHPHYIWMSTHGFEIGLLIILLFFVFLFLITPIIKKWKSLPEE